MKFLIRRKSLKNSAIIAVAFVPLLCATAVSALSVTSTIPVGLAPYGITSDGTHVWVANDGDSTVSEINASTGSVTNTISVGSLPVGITSDGTHVWVANNGDSTVSEINPLTDSVISTIQVGRFPYGITSDGTHVWVANNLDSTVSEINASTGSIVGSPISVGSYPCGITSDGTHVWVANNGDSTVSEINASTGSIVGSPISVGTHPVGITSDGTHVWVTNAGDSTVSEINASTHSVISTISVGLVPYGITSDGTHVWVTNAGDNSVSEIDASTHSVISTISVGSFPIGITSDGTHVWVANNDDSSVSEIPFNFSVTYANGGGTGSVPTQSSLAASSTFIVAASSLSYPGYAFSGWTDGVNTYRPGATYTIGSTNVTLTAVWNVYVSPIVYSKPTAPSSVTASLSNGTATVSFTPGSSGNLPTFNQIDMYINGQLAGNVCNVTGATSCPIANLGPDATFTFTVTAVNSKGSATSAVSNAVSYASPTTVPPTTTTTTTTVPPAKRTITCVKGKVTKKVTAVSPVCPAGYKKK